MVWLAVGLAVVAVVLALRGGGNVKDKVESLERDLRYRESQLAGVRAELEGRLQVLALHVAQLAAGRRVSQQMILEGRLFEDVNAAEAHRIVAETPGAVVLDVRTHDEYLAGHVKGALHIPVDQIERRFAEVPRTAPVVVVHCAAGARSASACEFLSTQKGYANLTNVAGPLIGSWPAAEVERGMPQPG